MTSLKPFGPKARKFAYNPPENDARINILEGSVRSAKTWTMIPKLIYLCGYDVGGTKLITGVSKQTIKNNVLHDVFDIIGPRNYHFNTQTGDLDLFGSKWIVMGAKDEGSEKYLRGLTVGAAYGDELTLLPRSFVLMLLNRMSPDGARAYFTTNPDTPFHYVKTELIDNEVLRNRGDVRTLHFSLNDNPNISEEYKEFVRNAYTGVFKLRYIEGLWVVAEGAIYRDAWSDDLLYDDKDRPKGLMNEGGHIDHFVSVDCGVDHPQVYLEFYDDGDTLWIEREYFWDSRKEAKQKTDAQYADDLQKFLSEAPMQDAQVIIPPECASFEAELVQRGIWVATADNDVMDGLRVCSTMMSRKKVRVNRRCKNLVIGIQTHAWDEKKAMRGIEEPIKVKDDAADAFRYGVKTKINAWRLAA